MIPYTNTLTISHRSKPIPYGGPGHVREDGDANYGFRYVKGNESLLRQIPELMRDEDLLQLALAINAPETGLFSAGCVSGSVDDENGHRRSGYMEFVINSRAAIGDAASYFPIFFHFDRFLHERTFAIPVSYIWELQPAIFTECQDITGFTCSVFLNTHYATSPVNSAQNWTESLNVLGLLLGSVPVAQADFLYPQ